MSAHDITISTSPVADHYADTCEKIIEFDSPYGGGLICFRFMADGTLSVEPYRLDDSVHVNLAEGGNA